MNKRLRATEPSAIKISYFIVQYKRFASMEIASVEMEIVIKMTSRQWDAAV
jgi:hypothetical protein